MNYPLSRAGVACLRNTARKCNGAFIPLGTHSRCLTSFRDAAARAVVDRAIDQLSSDPAGSFMMRDGPVVQVDSDVEHDALTWKSVVDIPSIPNVDSLTEEDLYPIGAPSWPKPDVAGDRGGEVAPILRHDEWADTLDLTAFPGALSVDPFKTVAADLHNINANIKALLGIDHPVLSTVARYFFVWDGGKKVRPTLVMLMAHAVNTHVAAAAGSSYTASGRISLSAAELVEGQKLAAAGVPALRPEMERKQLPAQIVLPLQRRLAEITELIHTASLLHDDVIDSADTRRGVSSVNKAFGNKLAVLAGDFLLARASVCLARLRNVPTVELLSTVIEHLVKGEVMQMRHALRGQGASRAAFDMYLRKTYYKTGSLMANSCKAIGLLGDYPDAVSEAAYRYGMHLGIAFQLIDDLLDYSGSSEALGKPAMNDIKEGLATAPVLYAAHRFPLLLPLIERKFDAPGDLEVVLRCITASNSLVLTRRLAIAHGNMALDAIKVLAPSESRTALAALVSKVLNRER